MARFFLRDFLIRKYYSLKISTYDDLILNTERSSSRISSELIKTAVDQLKTVIFKPSNPEEVCFSVNLDNLAAEFESGDIKIINRIVSEEFSRKGWKSEVKWRGGCELMITLTHEPFESTLRQLKETFLERWFRKIYLHF